MTWKSDVNEARSVISDCDNSHRFVFLGSFSLHLLGA